MKLLITLLTISVQLLNIHSNPCRWLDDGAGCVIMCLDERGVSASTISGHVQIVYDEFPDCHSTGIKLILPKEFTGSTVKADWLSTLNVNLTDLEIDAQFIMEFESNVFTSAVFTKVKKLNFKNFRLTETYDYDIKKTILLGFNALEELLITDSAVKIWNSGWLDNVNGTIKSLVVTGTGQEKPMEIENLTGGSSSRTLSNIEYVKIQYSLTNYVKHSSFTKIPNVRELDLSDCKITVIEEFTFENIGSALQILNLERNNLKTLPADIFRNLSLGSAELKILLGGNPWNCTCTLDHLKGLLNATTNFAGEILCETPSDIVNYPIRETEFCPSPVTTTSTSTTTTTTTEIPIVPTESASSNEKECSSLNDVQSKTKISIQPRTQQIQLTRTSDGVSIKLQKYSTDLIIIWFESTKSLADSSENYQSSYVSDCFANLSDPTIVGGLAKDTSYTFCLMNISQQTVSPYDCISYYNHGEEEQPAAVWLYANDKPLTISLIVVVCIANIFIGLVLGAIILKFNGYDSFSFRMAIGCWNDRNDSKKLDEVSNDRTPPLPPHPLRDIKGDEVYYY